MQLSEHELDTGTVRAELSRLRRVLREFGLAEDLLATRPYRLTQAISTDIDEVRAQLDSRRVGDALMRYPGPVLSRSVAPGVVAIREALGAELRAAVLASADPALILRWTQTAWGAEDADAWRAAVGLLPDLVGRRRADARAVLLEDRLRSRPLSDHLS